MEEHHFKSEKKKENKFLFACKKFSIVLIFHAKVYKKFMNVFAKLCAVCPCSDYENSFLLAKFETSDTFFKDTEQKKCYGLPNVTKVERS